MTLDFFSFKEKYIYPQQLLGRRHGNKYCIECHASFSGQSVRWGSCYSGSKINISHLFFFPPSLFFFFVMLHQSCLQSVLLCFFAYECLSIKITHVQNLFFSSVFTWVATVPIYVCIHHQPPRCMPTLLLGLAYQELHVCSCCLQCYLVVCSLISEKSFT